MLPTRQNEDTCGVVQNCFAGHSFISGVDWKKIFPINLRRPKLSRQPYILFNLESFSNLFPVHVEICVTLRAKKNPVYSISSAHWYGRSFGYGSVTGRPDNITGANTGYFREFFKSIERILKTKRI